MPEASDDEEYRRLCMATGLLFLEFGRFEGVLSASLRLHLANNIATSDNDGSLALSSAVYGGMRFKAARDAMLRVASAEQASDGVKAFLKSLFSHVAHIEDLRNRIAHQAVVRVHPDHLTPDGDWQVSDQTVTRDIRNLNIYVFHVEAIEIAAADLRLAISRLGNRTFHRLLFEDLDISPVPWRYKPSLLKCVPLGVARSAPR